MRHRMNLHDDGMSNTDDRRHWKTPRMAEDEEVDEEWILSPHAPQSTNPKKSERKRRLYWKKTSPDALR